MTKASKEAEAIKKLDKSALVAQERIQAAAEKAQKMIDDACAAATQALETSSRIPDKRNLDGSFQWDRGDRYRRGSDDRLDRLEDKVISINGARGTLEIGQARREEQIKSLLKECRGLHDELVTKKTEIEHLAADFEALQDETTQRTTTLRELVIELTDAAKQQNADLRLEFIKQHSEAMSNIQWKIIAALSSLAFLFILVFISYSFHVFGGLP